MDDTDDDGADLDRNLRNKHGEFWLKKWKLRNFIDDQEKVHVK